VPLTDAALKRSRELPDTDGLAMPLAAYLEEHVDEEVGHDETLLDDLELVGVDRATAVARMPSPTIAALVGSQYYWILHHHPLTFLGFVAVMEGYPPTPELSRHSSSGQAFRGRPSGHTSSTATSTPGTATTSTRRSTRSR